MTIMTIAKYAAAYRSDTLPHPLAITVTSFDLPEGYQDSDGGGQLK